MNEMRNDYETDLQFIINQYFIAIFDDKLMQAHTSIKI